MPLPTAIVFDLGKVLVDFDYSIAGRRLAGQSRMSPAEIQKYLDHSPLLVRYETGEINRREFFDEVCAHTGYGGTIQEFGAFFGGIFTPIEPMIALHAELRQRGYPTYILSNTNDLAVEDVRSKFPFFNDFDGYVFSYEVRSMKPDAVIYEALEKITGKRGPELLYIDDRHENIVAGAKRGWQTILHETPEQTRAAIGELGLLG
jgi:FMN phosphatase YigB (HAD superfamily)